MNIPKVYCTNLTIHNEPYILLKYNEFGFSVVIDKIKETLEANNTDYYNIRNKVYVSAKGMFHLEMELGHEIEFA